MWAERGIRAWAEGWWETPWRVGDQIGRIVGAPPGSTVMHQNVSIAEAVVLSCFRPVDPARNRVVYERGNFPSVRYVYQAQPDLEVVVCEDDAADPRRDRRADAADPDQPRPLQGRRDPGRGADRAPRGGGGRARRARLLPVGGDRPARRHRARRLVRGRRVGQVAPRRARERLALRAAGSRGDARALGDRAGRRTRARSRSKRSWSTRAGAARFLTGTPNVPAHYAGTAGYDLIEEIGVARIRERSLTQTQLLIDLADAAGFDVVSPREAARRGGSVVLRVPEFAAVHAELEARGILCDFRPDAGHPPRAALLQLRRGDPLRRRADRGDHRDGRASASRRRCRAALSRQTEPPD